MHLSEVTCCLDMLRLLTETLTVKIGNEVWGGGVVMPRGVSQFQCTVLEFESRHVLSKTGQGPTRH